MTSPDFREYIDLTVNDLQPDDIYSLARDYAIISLPEFNPRTGTVEDALLQSMSYVSALVTGAVNRLPNGLIEGLMRVMGMYRREATFASGNVIFEALDDGGLVIPLGTQVAYTESTETGTVIHIFETTETVTIASGDTESDPVPVSASSSGLKPVITNGENLTIVSPIARLIAATFSGTLTQGAETETDEEYFTRSSTYLGSLSRSLATAEQITNFVLSEYTQAYRVQTYDLTRIVQLEADSLGKSAGTTVQAIFAPANTSYYNYATYTSAGRVIGEYPASSLPDMTSNSVIRVSNTGISDYERVWGIDNNPGTSGSVTAEYTYAGSSSTVLTTAGGKSPLVEILDTVSTSASDFLGAVTIFVSDSTGASLSAEDKGDIADAVRERTIAGLNVYITDVILVYITVVVDIKVQDGYSSLDVKSAVDDYLTGYLSPQEYPFTNRIRKNQLIASVSQIEGVDYVDSLSLAVTSDSGTGDYHGSSNLASVSSGDIIFSYRGTLPVASVTVNSL